jgi:hypothetical protein
MNIETVCEPSDVIWMNRHYTDFQRHWKNATKWIITIILIAAVG